MELLFPGRSIFFSPHATSENGGGTMKRYDPKDKPNNRILLQKKPAGGAQLEKTCAFKGRKKIDGLRSLRNSRHSEVSGEPQRKEEENSAIFILLPIHLWL
ncbi:hypothetical protein AMECASPLE_015518 [Ameca splendens]|uniref:Uncharacterized protein n=1 Tax=Ameca splendens TaxID=208324 RepID=A0ABV0Y2A5_9TELE